MKHDWIVPDWPAPPGIRALITTRCGGASSGGARPRPSFMDAAPGDSSKPAGGFDDPPPPGDDDIPF